MLVLNLLNKVWNLLNPELNLIKKHKKESCRIKEATAREETESLASLPLFDRTRVYAWRVGLDPSVSELPAARICSPVKVMELQGLLLKCFYQ